MEEEWYDRVEENIDLEDTTDFDELLRIYTDHDEAN